jgi:DMSO/TMAO reductase YedYZ molybdopterin-dependent catalytic subunit
MAGPYFRLRARVIPAGLPRRQFLRLGGGAALGASLLPGCETLTVDYPPADDGTVGPEALAPISSNDAFYVVNYWQVAEVDREAWRITVRRAGTEIGALDWAFLASLPAREKEHTLQCIESRPREPRMDNAVWTGLPLREILETAGISIDPEAPELKFSAADGFSAGLPASDLDRPVWLVWRMNGEELSPEHGFPARLLCPGRFGWLNVKQITGIDFLDEPYEIPWLPALQQYMAAEGFHPESDGAARDLRVQSLIVHPSDLQFVEGGMKVRVLGKAYGGSDPVESVRLSADGGLSWSDAELTYAPGADVWALWRWIWEPPGPGRYELRVRAQTASGQQTNDDEPENLIPWTGGMAIEVEVMG